MSTGGQDGARHRDRRHRAEREVQRGPAGAAAGLLPAVPTERAARHDALLRQERRGSGSAAARRRRACSARLDPTLPVEDLKTLPQQVRENVFMDRDGQHAGVRVRAAGNAAGGGRALRRARVHRVAADARDRPAHGARRRWPPHAGDDPQAGRLDDARSAARSASSAPTTWARARESLLFEIKGHDPLVFALAVVVLGMVAFAAGYIPAYRASRVHPMQALRYE